MSEEIKARARTEEARILGTLPGCTTCVEAADTIARLTRERDEARKYANHFGRISEAQAKSLSNIVDVVQRYQPEGSPPSGDETVLTAWVLEQMHARATAAEAMVCEQEDTIARLTRKAVEQRARACAAEAKVAYVESSLAEVEERIIALEEQLATRGACQCGEDDVCAVTRRRQEAEARAAAAEERAQEAEESRDEWKWLYERMRDVVEEHRTRIAELEGALREACDLLDSYEDAAACEGDVTTVWLVYTFTRRARALLTPTALAAGGGARIELETRPLPYEALDAEVGGD